MKSSITHVTVLQSEYLSLIVRQVAYLSHGQAQTLAQLEPHREPGIVSASLH